MFSIVYKLTDLTLKISKSNYKSVGLYSLGSNKVYATSVLQDIKMNNSVSEVNEMIMDMRKLFQQFYKEGKTADELFAAYQETFSAWIREGRIKSEATVDILVNARLSACASLERYNG